MERRANRHRWTEKDDIVALYFYKFGDLGRTSSLAIVGEGRGMGAGSLRMRVANFRAIAGGGRLDHAALRWPLSKSVRASDGPMDQNRAGHVSQLAKEELANPPAPPNVSDG